MLGPSALMLVALLTHIGGPFMGSVPSVGVSISSTVSAHQNISYQITVRNSSDVSAPVTVRLTVPPGTLSELKAADAAVIANAVAWKAHLAAGEMRTFSLTGTVSAPSTLEAVACVHDAADSPALACATNHQEIQTDHLVRKYAWIASITLGALAVAGTLLLHRRIRPEFLTPPTAGTLAREPGGAPSA
jgi:hypothetical protein